MTSVFRISPLIRITLLSLYLALTLPLPFLAEVTAAPIPSLWLWIGIVIGFVAVYAASSDRVIVNDEQIQVTYPQWVLPIFRRLNRGWSLKWSEIESLKLRTTGQGGLVYYFLSRDSDKAYLLPMRIVGFAKLTRIVTEKTGIDTSEVRPLSQPWMYLILLGLTLLLLLIDVWTITTAIKG
jgi:hypothetical protein